MKPLAILFLLLFSFCPVLHGQQDVQLTQFMFDKLSFNPAYAGMSGAICATGIHRTQWVNFEGAPKTRLFNFQMPVKALHGGVGFTYYNDRLGFEANNIARLHYAYHTSLNGFDNFGIGVSAGIISKQFNADWLTPDGTVWHFDPSITSPSSSDITPDFSVGVYYTRPKLYMGLSSTHLSEQSMNNLNIQTARHYWVMAGYKTALAGNPQWEVNPNILAKSDGASTQIDINMLAHFKRIFWGGVSYRVADAVSPMIGAKHTVGQGMLSFGYSYDITTSKLSNYSNGTHELMLKYCFIPLAPELEKYANPR